MPPNALDVVVRQRRTTRAWSRTRSSARPNDSKGIAAERIVRGSQADHRNGIAISDVDDLYSIEDDTIVLSVHVQPRAGRSAVLGRHGRALKLRVAAAVLA